MCANFRTNTRDLRQSFRAGVAWSRSRKHKDERKLFYDKTYHCQYAKNSAPFGCEASTPLPISQCFSLAYANSLLLYTVFSAICVKIFFAAKKEPADEIDVEKPASL